MQTVIMHNIMFGTVCNELALFSFIKLFLEHLSVPFSDMQL